jgi:hypothetical protein
LVALKAFMIARPYPSVSRLLMFPSDMILMLVIALRRSAAGTLTSAAVVFLSAILNFRYVLSRMVVGGMEIIGFVRVITSEVVFRVLYAMITSLSDFVEDCYESKSYNSGSCDGCNDLAV